VKSNREDNDSVQQGIAPGSTNAGQPDLKNPQVVLLLLEADQVVAAKRQSRFGRRQLSPGVRILLWALRGYVVIMLIIVVIAVLRAMSPAH
jgi:hypothetical protein